MRIKINNIYVGSIKKCIYYNLEEIRSNEKSCIYKVIKDSVNYKENAYLLKYKHGYIDIDNLNIKTLIEVRRQIDKATGASLIGPVMITRPQYQGQLYVEDARKLYPENSKGKINIKTFKRINN